MRINELINEVDLSRRGFLRGLGAAGLSAAAGSAFGKTNPIVQQTVEPGDTIYSIARQNGITPQELFKLNGMDNKTKIVPGQKIKIPDVGKPVVTQQTSDDPLGDLIQKKMSPKEREDVIALFTYDVPEAPAVDKRNTGPADTKHARANALPKQDIKPKHTEPKKSVKELPQSGGSVPWRQVRDYLATMMDMSHWAGMLANMWHESEFIPHRYNPNDRGGPSGGMFQWHDNTAKGYHRFTDMTRAVPDWKTNWKKQIDFALREPEGRAYLNTHFSNPISASIAWTKTFERPADADARAKERAHSPQMRQYASNP